MRKKSDHLSPNPMEIYITPLPLSYSPTSSDMIKGLGMVFLGSKRVFLGGFYGSK
jgi:hypothetical protein